MSNHPGPAPRPYTLQLIRSRRKTLAIEIPGENLVIIRAPLRMPEAEIRRIVAEKQPWIEEHLARAANREAERRAAPVLTPEEIRRLADEALQWFPPRVRQRAARMGVRIGRITIRNQRTRWGSCTSKGNLNFNCLLMLCPGSVREYVIVHELCHRLEMNHSPRFWAEVEKQLPDYRQQRKWLKDNGAALLDRLR